MLEQTLKIAVSSGVVKNCTVNQDFFHFVEEKFSQKIKLQALWQRRPLHLLHSDGEDVED